jgi:hypothetical protein
MCTMIQAAVHSAVGPESEVRVLLAALPCDQDRETIGETMPTMSPEPAPP